MEVRKSFKDKFFKFLKTVDRRVAIMVFIFLTVIVSIALIPYKKPLREEKVNVSLIGNKSLNIALNTDYRDEGFKVTVNDEEIPSEKIDYSILENINSNVVGQYEIIYDIKYKNKKYQLAREVNVVDLEAPIIEVANETIDVYYCKKDSEINLDYQAHDNYDGDITDKVKVERLDDKIVLSVADSAGNKTVKEVALSISEKPSPVINLNGNSTIYIQKGSEYREQGASASDGCGKKIDEDIIIDSHVDTSKVGEQKVTYSLKSDTGKTYSKERKIIVYEVNESPNVTSNFDKVVYLTFDDGPGQYTEKLLNILDKYHIKVTFFVTNQFKNYVPLIEREYESGHTVAVHSLTHKWSIYKSVETYVKDFNDMNDIIYKYTGTRSEIFRFPGGSSNTVSRNYATGVVKAIRSKMTEYGYVYFDWNVDSNDAAGANKTQIYNNVIKGIKNRKSSVVLMHDIKANTISVIEDIINYGLANGYTFLPLTKNAPTVHHSIQN